MMRSNDPRRSFFRFLPTGVLYFQGLLLARFHSCDARLLDKVQKGGDNGWMNGLLTAWLDKKSFRRPGWFISGALNRPGSTQFCVGLIPLAREIKTPVISKAFSWKPFA